MSLPTALPRRLAAGLITAVALGALAACGSSGDAAGTPAGTSGDGPGGGGRGGGAMSAYFQCLQQNGVTLTRPSGAPPSGAPGGDGAPPSGGPGNGRRPSGGPGGPGGGGRQLTKPDGVSDETWTKATEACASLAPTPAATS